MKKCWYISFLFTILLGVYGCGTLNKMAEASEETEEQEQVEEDYVSEDAFVPNSFEYEDFIYKENIHTALLQVNGSALAYPIISLNNPQQLVLSFDDLDGDFTQYYYKLIHCNADWTVSDLTEFDYIEGFTEESIDDYRFAFNTLQDYTQYRVGIPNRNMQFTKSGNYILMVFQDNDVENIVLTKRFMVYEQQARITSSIVRSSITRYVRTHQQLRFSVDHTGMTALNPLTDIKVVVLQNGRWDNAIMNLKPQFIRTNELVYDFRDQGLFKAGKEFRNFDSRDLQFLSERIRKTWEDDKENHVMVVPDGIRQMERYQYNKDLNGRYFVGRYGGTTRLDADYAHVHFTLQAPEAITNGNVYVYGGLSDWQAKKDF